MAQPPIGVYRFDVMMDLAVVKAKLGNRQEAVAIFHRGIKKILTLYPLEDRGSTKGSMSIAHLLYIAIREKQAGLVEESRQLVLQALQAAREIVDPYTRYYTYEDIAVAQLKLGDREGAQRTLDVLFVNMLPLKGEKPFESSYRKMKSVLRIAETYLELQNIKQAREEVTNAFHMYEKLPTENIDKVFNALFFWESLAVMAGRVGDSAAAQRTLGQIYEILDVRAQVAKIETTLRVAQALIEGKQQEAAAKVVEKGYELARAWKKGAPNSFEAENYSFVWRQLGLTKALLGDVEGALEADTHLPQDGTRIGKAYYQKVAYVAAEKFDEAFRIVKTEDQIDYYRLLVIVEGQAKQQRVEAAMEAFDLLKDHVSKVLNKFEVDFMKRRPPDYLQALRAVAVAQGRWGKVAQAVAWARSQETSGEKAHALLGVAEGLLEKSHLH